ncbi:RNA recognition motif domain and Nucleotide-binding, alpha-beta plait domain-containing protein [Strongyloides ratti]|uniref:RNA recognition motif domain and Nucleotide-binding, alpha-beta plait domain-containing protein n=1 Tax=Strongyloides ratti TaxID=34506 RepID=A0A090MYQ2_STRRB|nr:RNA recognition motif domain and Nucleotide-binding, alpha-beta plait domain-containing protein [Strongyloides ratti]CEF67579.1 RNA recognition motif domain and Nucleotide-binding, alpha-beta plait domain-containing protein [Strongyloides ratti]
MSKYNLFYNENNCTRDDRTIYVRNLDSKVTKEILWELFSQVGNVQDVFLPPLDKDKNEAQYALVSFKTIHSPIFASEMMNGISLYGKQITVQPKGKSMHSNLFMDLRKNGQLAYQVEQDMMRNYRDQQFSSNSNSDYRKYGSRQRSYR